MFSTCIMHEKCALPFPGIAVPQKFWRVGVGSKQQRNTKKAKKNILQPVLKQVYLRFKCRYFE